VNAGNDPAAWQNFYIMIGTANAAITGLLFVALSIHLREILAHPLFKPRAIVVLVVLTLQIIISAIVLAPQPRVLMGVEILVLNVGFIALNLRQRSAWKISAGLALTLGIRIVYVWAAISLIIGVGGGFYVLGAILVITIARSMNNCWTLLTALEAPTASG
jgi:modulator of FtsH protease